MQSALKEAQAVIERTHVLRLTATEWNWLLDLMDAPSPPNVKLQAAIARYHQAKLDDAGSSFSNQP